jgi:hypothetical protein
MRALQNASLKLACPDQVLPGRGTILFIVLEAKACMCDDIKPCWRPADLS